MSARIMLIKALILAYLSGHIGDMDMSMVDETIETIIKDVDLPESTFAVDHERDMLVGLIGLIKDVRRCAKEVPYDRDRVLSEVKLICGEIGHDLFNDIVGSFPKETATNAENRKQLLQVLNSATRIKREKEIRKVINSANIAITVNSDKMTNINDFVDNLIGRLEAMQVGNTEDDPAVVTDLNFNEDREGVEDVFQKHLDLEDERTVWHLNWKALNDAFQGGWRPGDFILIGAMQHNYKSQLTMSLFRGLAKYNKAKDFIRDPLKKPMLSRISFEDSIVNNLSFLALNVLWNNQWNQGNEESGVVPDISNLSKKDLADIVMDDMSSEGWMIHMSRVNGDDWSYKDVAKKILSLEAEGYDVRAMVLDYFLLISKKHLNFDSAGSDARNLLRKLKSIMASRDILGITPTQLSPKVKHMIADGTVAKNDLLPHIKDLGMFSESSKLPEEPEVVMYINKVKFGEVEYLHVVVEKHRYMKTILHPHLWSFYMKFPSNGLSIPDDPDGKRGICTYRPPSSNMNSLYG